MAVHSSSKEKPRSHILANASTFHERSGLSTKFTRWALPPLAEREEEKPGLREIEEEGGGGRPPRAERQVANFLSLHLSFTRPSSSLSFAHVTCIYTYIVVVEATAAAALARGREGEERNEIRQSLPSLQTLF